jgi:hypothetical protein
MLQLCARLLNGKRCLSFCLGFALGFAPDLGISGSLMTEVLHQVREANGGLFVSVRACCVGAIMVRCVCVHARTPSAVAWVRGGRRHGREE